MLNLLTDVKIYVKQKLKHASNFSILQIFVPSKYSQPCQAGSFLAEFFLIWKTIEERNQMRFGDMLRSFHENLNTLIFLCTDLLVCLLCC